MKVLDDPYSTSTSRLKLSILPPIAPAPAFVPGDVIRATVELRKQRSSKKRADPAPSLRLVGRCYGMQPAQNIWVSAPQQDSRLPKLIPSPHSKRRRLELEQEIAPATTDSTRTATWSSATYHFRFFLLPLKVSKARKELPRQAPLRPAAPNLTPRAAGYCTTRGGFPIWRRVRSCLLLILEARGRKGGQEWW